MKIYDKRHHHPCVGGHVLTGVGIYTNDLHVAAWCVWVGCGRGGGGLSPPTTLEPLKALAEKETWANQMVKL
jgi:hypothetical protein